MENKDINIRFAQETESEVILELIRGLAAYENMEEWHHIVEHAMSTDFSWKNSAKEYRKLYEQLIAE